ncbi:unnamed protein product [Strongylus vulgaris]|uniref:Uncharacterized protein n=1 Tax=Strongylus vulgaris TaxID=40348 RepID=A0A3P7INC5_STRVU|nr:unnamed protein product [Strongylus vulgaris]
MIWAHPSDIGTSSRESKDNSFAPPSAAKPPSLLCANELYLQHEKRSNSKAESIKNGLKEEEESGPDWFRNMDSNTSFPMKDSDQRLSDKDIQTTDSHFDPLPITIEGFQTGQNEEKKSLSAKPSLPVSPTKAQYGDDIDRAFDVRVEQLLAYICTRERLRDHRWKSIILNLAKEISHTVKIDVAKRRDQMNILNYVHVKKLYVDDEEPRAELIWGVVCSKSVSHESMADPLRDASVMIVAGSIEYERIPGRLSTLEPILCQEGEFLAKQVERIMSRRPSVLLVEGNVSRIASNLLREAGVRLVVNVSTRILHRVARSTGADILPSSDAQLIQQNIGFCPYFTQRTVYLKDGHQKLLIILDECPPDRGCSVLIKGSDARELRAVKRILLFLTSLLYSARLEKVYLNMFNIRLAYQISNCEICEARREVIDHNNEKSDFEIALADSVLSASPFIDHEPPYLKSVRGKNCSLLPYFNVPVYQFFNEEDFDARLNEEDNETEQCLSLQSAVPVPDKPRHFYARNGARDANNRDDLAAFRALGGAIFKRRIQSKKSIEPPPIINKVCRVLCFFVNILFSNQFNILWERQHMRRHDMLDPYVHQRIAVLFGSFSPKSPNAPYFCVRPWVVNMEFYGPHDMTLGEFLTK